MKPKPEPKFKVGQFVVMKSLKRALPMKILEVKYLDEAFWYRWDKRNWANEHMLREMNDGEKGTAPSPATGTEKEE